MHKIIFSIMACLLFTLIQAQDAKTASKLFDAGEMPKAKKAIDEALAGTQANMPQAWIIKHKIYWAISHSSQSKTPLTDMKLEGFNALAKAYTMPKGQDEMIKEVGLNINAPLYNYYTAFIADGSALLDEGDNNNALKSFKAALTVSDFFYSNKLSTTALDTMLIFYAGYAAMKNNDNNIANYYFKKLVDANATGVDLQIAYGWLCNYYLKDKQDATTAKIICDKGLVLYPTDEYLLSVKKQIAGASGNTENVFALYEETISKGNASFNDYIGYAAELYDYLYVNEGNHTITNAAAKEKRLVEMLTKAISLKNNSAEANYIMGMYYTSKALDVDKEIKTTTDAAKKTELKNKADEWVLNSITYLETTASLFEAMPSKTESQKNHYKSAMRQLINLYAYKGLSAKKTAAENKLKVL